MPENLFIVENISFDLQLELSIFKSQYFLFEVVLDHIQFDSHLLSSKSLFSKADHELWFNFDKLQSLVDQLKINNEKTYIQYQIENLATISSSNAPPNT